MLYVLEIPKNLVSKLLLSKDGFWIIFESDRVILLKNEMFMGKDYVCDELFKLSVMVIKPKINKNNNSYSVYMLKSSNLCHGRLGHVIMMHCLD